MSYTEHYSTSISYSGSVSYSYPASEHGGSGTVHYSGSVPVNIEVEVNTLPFEESVDGAKLALAGVTGALTAAEAAQVAAIQEAGQTIARSATQGFFSVLKSEMSSRVAEFSSAMRSCMGLILEEARAIENVHQQMDADYHAIKGRYQRIFGELDRELDRRIKELDRSAFQLSERSMRGVVAAPLLERATQAYTQMGDAGIVPLKLGCANTKSRTSDALGNLGEVCDMIGTYECTVDAVMAEGAGEEEVTYLPVVYAVQSDLTTGAPRTVVCQSPVGNDATRNAVMSFVARQTDTSWVPPTAQQRGAVEDGFLRRIEGYANNADDAPAGLDRDRVCRLMLSLYRQAGTRTTYSG